MDEQTYNSMDVDDLFGDAEHVPLPNLTTIQTPLLKGLTKRLDELGASGCCSTIAWSKNGCVANITTDGLAVCLRVFSRDLSTGEWALGKVTYLAVPPGHDECPFVHLSWSHLGNDLAVVDAVGRIMVFTCAMALDRMTYMPADITQIEREADAVVGMHWLAILPYEQKNHIAWSADLSDGKWKFNISSHIFHDMHHPVEGKASMIYLKRQGDLKLRFQQPDNSWQEVSCSLGPLLTTEECFTHAAFVSNNDNTLLLAAMNVAGRLHLYQIRAAWNVPAQKHPQQPPRYYEKPELDVSELMVEDNCHPSMIHDDLNGGPASNIRLPAQLTHLHFLPATPEEGDGTQTTIQAIFSTPPNTLTADPNTSPITPVSIIVTWEVGTTQQPHLHTSLDGLTSKKKSVSSVPSRTVWYMKRQNDLMMHSVVLTFTPVWYTMTFCFCYSDGTVEFRKRSTGTTISPNYDATHVTSMAQSGFAFLNLKDPLHTALSPNHCVVACMRPNGKVNLRSLQYTYGVLSSQEDDARHDAAIAALVLQATTAANQYFCSDDLFYIMGHLARDRQVSLFKLMFESLNVNIDCGIDDQSSNNHFILLGRSPFFVKILSAIHLLGLQSPTERTLVSKIAWATLNIKYVTQVLTNIARIHGQLEKNPLRPEAVPRIVGICRWIMHFMTYIVDELISLARHLREVTEEMGSPITRELVEAKLSEFNSPALLVLLASFPRMMMKLWAQPLAWIIRTAITYINGNGSPDMRKLYAPLQQAVGESPVNFTHFDQLISEAQLLAQSCYMQANLRNVHDAIDKRNRCERELLLGRIPPELWPAAQRLLTDSVWGRDAGQTPALADKVDVAKVLFFDTTWLGLGSSRHARQWFDSHVVDVCQKTIIRGPGMASHQQGKNRGDGLTGLGLGLVDGDGAGSGGPVVQERRDRKLRTCVRCGACMEDVTIGSPGYGGSHINWLMGVAKHCICGNSWMLTDDRKGSS